MDDVRRRDGFRGVVSVLTALGTVAAATAVGMVTGLAARDTEQQAAGDETTTAKGDHARRHREEREVRPVVHWKDRPRRTVYQTRTVVVTDAPSGPATSSSSSSSTSSSTSTGSTASLGGGSVSSGGAGGSSGGAAGGGSGGSSGGSGPSASSSGS